MRLRTMLAAVAIGGLVLAGCSSDGPSESTAADEGTTTETSAPTATTLEDATTTTAGSGQSTGSSDFCEATTQLREVRSETREAIGGIGSIASADLEQLDQVKLLAQQVDDAYVQLAAAADPELVDAIEQMRQADQGSTEIALSAAEVTNDVRREISAHNTSWNEAAFVLSETTRDECGFVLIGPEQPRPAPGQPGEGWNDDTTAEFIAQCADPYTRSGDSDFGDPYCQCLVDMLRITMSADEAKWAHAIGASTGASEEPPQAWIDAADTCLDQNIDQLGG